MRCSLRYPRHGEDFPTTYEYAHWWRSDRTSSSGDHQALGGICFASVIAFYLKLFDNSVLFKDTYCQSIGVDYMFINDLKECDWIRRRFERPGVTKLSAAEKKLTLKRLIRACKFEEYLAKKWGSEKRFGVEGCEVLVPAMKTVIDESAQTGVDSFVIGMPHR